MAFPLIDPSTLQVPIPNPLFSHESLVEIRLNPAETLNPSIQYPIQWRLKRMMDIFLAGLGLIALFPVFIFLALCIKLDSKGPVFFSQTRFGLNGKPFKMYKFRSMTMEAESQFESLLPQNQSNPAMFKLFKDPRVTPFGKLLRKYSLDELPQLVNVIKGEMSLVGPRPPIQRELAHYQPWHFVRFSTLPGITGAWQVNGRSRMMDFDGVVQLDYHYIRHWSLFADLKILLKTIPVVLFAQNTA